HGHRGGRDVSEFHPFRRRLIMGTSRRERRLWPLMAWITLSYLALLASSPQIATAQHADQTKALKEKIAQAEKQVAIKAAALKVAEAHKAVAQARLNALKADVDSAKAAAELTAAQLQRLKELVTKGVVSKEELDATVARHQQAMAQVQKALAAVTIGEAEIA